jgi:hypothetical protein
MDERHGDVEDFAVSAIQRPPPVTSHPGYVSGLWYGAQDAAINAATAVAADTLYAHPVSIFSDCRVGALALRVGALGAGLAKMGIYSTTGGRPGALVAEAATDVDLGVAAGTVLTASLTGGARLPAGVYWLASCFSAATAIPNTMAAATLAAPLGNQLGAATAGPLVSGSAGPNCRLTRTAALTFVAATAFLPASFGAVTLASTAPGSPILAFQIA